MSHLTHLHQHPHRPCHHQSLLQSVPLPSTTEGGEFLARAAHPSNPGKMMKDRPSDHQLQHCVSGVLGVEAATGFENKEKAFFVKVGQWI
jgi:hypothetical protein